MGSGRARARPWRAIIFSVLAIVAAGASYAFGSDLNTLFEPGHLANSIAAAAAATAFFIFASIAVMSLAGRARETLQSVTGSAHAAVVRYAIVLIGAILTITITLQVGDMVLLRSGALGGQLEGIVTEIGITYLQLDMGNGVMSLPNSQVLAAAVSRRTTAAEP